MHLRDRGSPDQCNAVWRQSVLDYPQARPSLEFDLVVPSANPAAGPARTGPDRPPRPIAVYLFVLALVALVPAFAFSAVLLQRNNEAQERVVEALITGSARSIMQAVDREVFANISTLKVLATTKTLEGGDLAGFYNQVKTALEGTNTYVYALDSAFNVLMSTRVEFGAPSGHGDVRQRCSQPGPARQP